jgi:CrcB protein
LKTFLIDAAMVGSGGFIGAISRYGLNSLVYRKFSVMGFPWGTLLVNLIGCFVIGALIGLLESREIFGPGFRRFMLIGLIGSFTTYSTFGYETFVLIKGAEYFRATANIGLHVVLGLALVFVGYGLTVSR